MLIPDTINEMICLCPSIAFSLGLARKEPPKTDFSLNVPACCPEFRLGGLV